MRRRPLGCLTGTALLFAAATVVLLACAALVTGNGIFAPGPLNAEAGVAAVGDVRSHGELSSDCGACHVPIWSGERMTDRCLACHRDVGDELAGGTGLHGRFATFTECRACHTDHGGETASLTLANPPDFPHDRTRYSLQAHPVGRGVLGGGFACADCHPATLAEFEPATCATCHERRDPAYLARHVETFGEACLACHDGVDAYGADFAHANWPLEGEHAAADCSGCHAGAADAETLRATPTECAACHAAQDVHEGRLGADCGTCHTAAGWEDASDGFDHARTAFALVGRHAEVDCLACHVDRAWTGIGTTCEACHAGDDPHEGQFSQSCAACHTPEEWDEMTFDHATTRFPLEAAHAEPSCEACHSGGRYALTPRACFSCHEDDDAHEGNLGRDCASCHEATAWDETTFDHGEARFPLTGQHARALCTACHTSLTMYRGTATTCFACHREDDAHDRAFGTDCAACHGTRSWEGASFDHARTGFRLTGAHTRTSCAACHPGDRFEGTPSTCYGCHRADDRHDGDFGRQCASCHTTSSWSGARVDHSLTRFPLTGAHRGVSCSRCHRSDDFREAPTTCSGCHRKPSTHQPRLFSACASCHTTRAWRPADYDAPHPFPMNHRNADGRCSRCHPASWASWSCASCHPYRKMDEEHDEEAGYSRTACVRCHPDGRKEDDD
jgi:hypothetical protein